MADDKRYYWIKLKDSFINSDAVDFLMGQPNGAEYVILYQMLCLKTINTNGEFVRHINEVIIPYDVNKIQRDTKYFSVDTIRVALELYKSLGLVYVSEKGNLKIANFERLVGSESEWAEKKRLYRAQQPKDKSKDNVPKLSKTNSDKRLEIRDKIIDNRDIDNTEINNNILSPTLETIKSIIEYLNAQIGTQYRYQTPQTQKHIKARLAENFTLENFKTVIDKKVAEWKGTEMEQFLRPETLFGTKFESYLNGAVGKPYNKNNPQGDTESILDKIAKVVL